MMQYGAFACCYDRMMHDVDYPAWCAYLDGFLQESGARSVLDCACGTGKLTIGLAQRGYTVIGSDLSEDMLMEARRNALQAGLRFLPFVCQNMTALSVHRPVDAVISVCDGVNYLASTEDVLSFFNSVNRCLKPGGLLLFDVSSEYKLSTVLGGETLTETTDDYAYIWENAYDPRTRLIEMDLTFFVREGSLYRRFSEQHVQRAHTESEIVALLTQAGFSEIRVFDAFTHDPVRKVSERIQFTARKNRGRMNE